MWTVHGVIVLILVIYCLMALTEVGFTYEEKPLLPNNRSLKALLKIISVLIIFCYMVLLCVIVPIFALLLLVPVVNLLLIPIALMLAVLLIPMALAIFLAGERGYSQAHKKTVIRLIYSFLALLLIVHLPIALHRKDLYSQLHHDLDKIMSKKSKSKKIIS